MMDFCDTVAHQGLIIWAGVYEFCDGSSGALGDVFPRACIKQGHQHGDAPGRAHGLSVGRAASHQVCQRLHCNVSGLNRQRMRLRYLAANHDLFMPFTFISFLHGM